MVPFGLVQAPVYFQALINKVLKGLHKLTIAYLDDIIIFSKDEERRPGASQDHLLETESGRTKTEEVHM